MAFQVSNNEIVWEMTHYATIDECLAGGWRYARRVSVGGIGETIDLWRGPRMLPKEAEDVINKPSHYTFGSDGHKLKHEPIDVIEDWQLPYHLACAVKYISRAGRKDPAKKLEDLEKACWYLKRYIEKNK